MRAPLAWAGDTTGTNIKTAGTQGFRHNSATNVAWADGHTSPQRDWFIPATYTSLIDNSNRKIKIGFLAEDNRPYALK